MWARSQAPAGPLLVIAKARVAASLGGSPVWVVMAGSDVSRQGSGRISVKE